MKPILIFVVLICANIFSGCKRDKCPDIVTQHDTLAFTPTELSKMPYTGYDTLYFLNKQGDTCIVRGTGKKYSYETQTEASGIGCGPEKITYYPICAINFISIKGDLEYKILMSKKDWSLYIYPLFNDRINEPYFQTFYHLIGIQNPTRDSLYINSFYYRNIYEMGVFKGGVAIEDTTYRTFINQTNGVLYLKSDEDNKAFSLLNK